MADAPNEDEGVAQERVTSAAAQMVAAREAAGISLQEVAQRTRVPLRHLEALEQGDYGALPSMTYCTGFARAYARAVGLDEGAIVAQLRQDVAEMGGLGQNPYEFEEAVNPARVPPRSLAWVAALLVILLAAGYGIWRMQLNAPPTDDQIDAQRVQEQAESAAANSVQVATPATPAPAGPVVLTAADDVWLRIYETDGKRLYEGTLARGQSFTVPADARDPLILTGRPDALAVTVGGQAIPPLGTAERTISDVPISATALLARPKQPASDDAAPVDGSNAIAAPATPPAPNGSNPTR